MATFITLEYGGTEKTLANWGFDLSTARCDFQTLAPSTFMLRCATADVEDDPAIPFAGSVIIRRDRESSTGNDDSFSGGTIEFQGKRTWLQHSGDGSGEGLVYTFSDPWWDLQNTAYLQPWRHSSSPPAMETQYASEGFLFTQYNASKVNKWEKITAGGQITNILQFLLDQYSAQSMSAPFAIGTISPTFAAPVYQVKEITCAEAIIICLRGAPDAVAWFDHSTTPPTFYVKYRSELTAASLSMSDGNLKSVSLISRDDLVPRSVLILFRQTNEDSGVPYVKLTRQKYGPNGADSNSDPETGLRVLIQNVELEGGTIERDYGHTVTTRVSVNAAAPLATLRWWAKRSAEAQEVLDSYDILGELPTFLTATVNEIIVDEETGEETEGGTVSLTSYPNELVDGSGIKDWMGVTSKKVIIRQVVQDFSTAVEFEGASGWYYTQKWVDAVWETKCVVCNAPAGEKEWKTVLSMIEGESEPAGLAQRLYESLATLQYEGNVTLIGESCPATVGIENTLNITGGKTEWTTMNAVVTGVSKSYGMGETTIDIGPPSYLSAQEFTSLFNFNRWRRTWFSPAVQNLGIR